MVRGVVFVLLVAVTLPVVPRVRAICTTSLSADRVASCAFNPLLLLVERSGWVLSRQNCGETIGSEAFEVPPIVYFDYTEPEHLYTVVFVVENIHQHPSDNDSTERTFYLQWLVVNIPDSSLANGMRYMDGDTIVDYLSPMPRSADDDGDVDGQPTRYGVYLYEQVYGTIYPPTPNTREYFNLDGWIGTIYPEAALCGPVASIGFGV
uniref:Secreted protein n=1 Tax=Anopheles funestus TaxID=62324 RepID=A0A4Y0BPK6_ANOFN